MCLKPKDLSACESEERGRGEGGGTYTTLMEADAVETSVCTRLLPEGDTRPGRTFRQPNNLSACESEKCGRGPPRGEGPGLEDLS
jgi:hypothetical protein